MPHRREPQGGSARTHACAAMEGVGQSSRPHRGSERSPRKQAQHSSVTTHISTSTAHRVPRRHQIDQMSRERGDGSERNSACTARRHTGGVSVLPDCNNLVIAILGIGFPTCEKCTCGCGVAAAAFARPARRASSCVLGARPPDPGTSYAIEVRMQQSIIPYHLLTTSSPGEA